MYAHAIEILERLRLTAETEAMWRSLADAAMEDLELTVAERAYAVLGDVSRARFVRKLAKIAAECDVNHWAVQARLATVQKQLHRAEAILLEHDQLEEAITLYQDLHRFDDAIRIAEKKGHPNIMQLKSRYLEELLRNGQDEQAGQLQEREGNYHKALQLYLKAGMPTKAASLVKRVAGQYPQELLMQIANALAVGGMHDKSGEILEKMGLVERAMTSYRKGHGYRQAVELAKQHDPAQVVVLEEEWGDWLVTNKQVESAIKHFIEAGASRKAIEAAIKAGQWSKAEQLLDSLHDPTIASGFYVKIGQHYAQTTGQLDIAERFLLKANKPNEAVEMYLNNGEVDKADKIAKKHMNQNDMVKVYSRRAQEHEAHEKLREAERVYLGVNDVESAINMYKKREQWDEVVRLVTKFKPEMLQETQKHIAERMEMKGNLITAEHFYIAAKSWPAAVSMYRQAEKWGDAKRVAKQHGGQSAFQKVVLAHAQAIAQESGAQAGAQLLAKHDLVEVAIDYALEHNNIEHAQQLAEHSAPQKMSAVHLKKALIAEDEERFKDAEDEFILAGRAKEALDMYTHQRNWACATRVAEKHSDAAACQQVMIAHAEDCVEAGQFTAAEALFIEAKAPQKAIEMYQLKNMKQDAVRVCKKHAPQLLPEVLRGESKDSGSKSIRDLLEEAKAYEETRNYSKAIQSYLTVTKDHSSDAEVLDRVWDKAVRLASSHLPNREVDIVRLVAQRLMEIERFESAGEMYESLEQYEDAVNCYIKGEIFDRAKSLASAHVPKMTSVINDRLRSNLVNKGDGDELAKRGDVGTALEMYARSGEWKSCLELAQEQAPKHLNHYLMQNVKSLMKNGDYLDSCNLLLHYGPPNDGIELYKVIATELLNISDKNPTMLIKSCMTLRNMLIKLLPKQQGISCTAVSESKVSKMGEFRISILAAHYLATYTAGKLEDKLKALRAKQAVALLRYVSVIPVDKAFYEAGCACKAAGMPGMAFLFLNRYLDIVDAIDDPDSAHIDNVDLEETDLPTPDEICLPEEQGCTLEQIEEVRDWVLGWSVDPTIAQGFKKKNCDKCRAEIYEASLYCSKCDNQFEPCVVTGYPVNRLNKTICQNCGSIADKSDWSTYVTVFKKCPWCLMNQ
eukprot:GHVL01012886.1.p1 GENE.GHVL01012886.1~~GHVL01012886.1.p1  ORF type:complete len:1133 (-),score=240.96 GHVL01012886.1:417-3815(-)